MKRLYFLLSSINVTCQTVKELTAAGVNPHHIHAAASHGSEIPCVHQATILQTSQFIHGTGTGLLVGGLAGGGGGGLAMLYPPPNLLIGTWGLVWCVLLGAALGAILGGTLARDRLNPEILPYEGAILRGKILLIVDIPKTMEETIIELVRLHHPEAILHH